MKGTVEYLRNAARLGLLDEEQLTELAPLLKGVECQPRVVTRYDRARAALAEAHRIDDVKSIIDKAAAMQEYARRAKDSQMIEHATYIRLHAERKAGLLLKEMAERRERVKGGDPKSRPATLAKLDDLGVSNSQSSRWQKLGELDDEAFEARAASAKRQAISSIEETAKERAAGKMEARTVREQTLGAKQTALPDKQYGVIYCDPPWRFEPWSRETGMGRSADNHYPTLAIGEMLTLPIAANDCILFMWATVPMLTQALQLMEGWGFGYRSHCVWAKDKIGTGYWFRNKHELLLVGVRGNIPAPAMGTQWHSLIEAPVGKHSAKPEKFLEMIEAYFPTLPKIELFRRGPPRCGWDAWGNEAEAAE